ncbi:(2Fe-2S)-binding protein [Billgrantia pellis]|uniref:(2Fe-2S)-binding protein n=1 Tax=Billgrantia pellis TaxID=2606936 RepID=A0A7V7KFA9_9GAMM|nr:(2Fe-2S)-binding protein [Halomonas pellis]KAA0010412.1 (2Fe-2S)-binding protein [Halomonas pellis]
MFQRLSLPDMPRGSEVSFRFGEQELQAREGDSVAAALLASDVLACRSTPVSGSPRAPYCMMGVCFECLVEVDGVPNVQACQVPVRDGMRIRPQHGTEGGR